MLSCCCCPAHPRTEWEMVVVSLKLVLAAGVTFSPSSLHFVLRSRCRFGRPKVSVVHLQYPGGAPDPVHDGIVSRTMVPMHRVVLPCEAGRVLKVRLRGGDADIAKVTLSVDAMNKACTDGTCILSFPSTKCLVEGTLTLTQVIPHVPTPPPLGWDEDDWVTEPHRPLLSDAPHVPVYSQPRRRGWGIDGPYAPVTPRLLA